MTGLQAAARRYSRPLLPPPPAPEWRTCPLSAKSPAALAQLAADLAGNLAARAPAGLDSPALDLYTLVGNLATRRTHLPCRKAFAAASVPALIADLRAFAHAHGAEMLDEEGEGDRIVLKV
eukprot:7086124-Pyramimonas_sp.AAC.1